MFQLKIKPFVSKHLHEYFCGEHRYTMRWVTWPAPVHYVDCDVVSTGTLLGG